MRSWKTLSLTGVTVAMLALSGCAAPLGDTPFFLDQGTQNQTSTSGNTSPSSSDQKDDAKTPSSGNTQSGKGEEQNAQPTDPADMPGIEASGVKVDENGSVTADSVVITGVDPSETPSEEELQKILDEQTPKDDLPDDAMESSPEHLRAAVKASNGLASSVRARDWTTACEEYVYISYAESVSECAAELQKVYGTNPLMDMDITADNIYVIVESKSHMASRLKNEYYEDSQQTQYQLIDGKWKVALA